MGSSRGVQVVGLTGRGLTSEDLKWLAALQEDLKTKLPEFAALKGCDAYRWMASNLEKFPEEYHKRARNMTLKVGGESGTLSEIASRTTTMYAGMLSFFAELAGNQFLPTLGAK
jgi:hypothetical protein